MVFDKSGNMEGELEARFMQIYVNYMSQDIQNNFNST